MRAPPAEASCVSETDALPSDAHAADARAISSATLSMASSFLSALRGGDHSVCRFGLGKHALGRVIRVRARHDVVQARLQGPEGYGPEGLGTTHLGDDRGDARVEVVEALAQLSRDLVDVHGFEPLETTCH